MPKQALRSAVPLLVSFAIICLGHGLQSVLLPARGAMFEHYPNLATGAMMSGYYAGFIAGTFICPRLIARAGHIRVFSAGAACCASIMLLHALVPNPLAWIVLRAIYGFCLVNLYTVMESWLNTIGTPRTRGKILSTYMIVNFLAMSAGQMLFFLAPAEGFELFSVSAILLSLALVPLAISRSAQPSLAEPPERFGLRRLFTVSPLGVAGALAAGLMGGAYWGLTAVFVLKMGFSQESVATFMAASLIGGLAAQYPLGSLSDRINRRYVILLASAIVTASAFALFALALAPDPAESYGISGLIVIGALFGAGFHPLYSLCIAHANDYVPPEYFVRTSAGLQFIQGAGAVAGPLLAGFFMYLFTPAALFAYIGGLCALFMLYTLSRLTENRRAGRYWSPFRFISRTGAFVFHLDPRRGKF